MFGGICQDTKKGFLDAMLNRKISMLFQEIIEHIDDSSIIFSPLDCWHDYNTEELEKAGFQHLKIKSSV